MKETWKTVLSSESQSHEVPRSGIKHERTSTEVHGIATQPPL
jgi:hypothetical protein